MLSLSACDQEDDEAGSPDASPTEAITPGEDEDGATEEETTPEEETASEEEETTPEEETAPADEESTDNGEGAEDEEGAQDEEGAEDGEDADAGAGAGGVTETEVITDPIFGTDGYPTADWSITDRTGEPAFGCWAESGAALEGLAYLCGASADYGVACLANPLAADEVICAVDPVARTGYRHKIEGGLPNAPTEQFTPLMVQLADGSTWRMRSGGAGIETPDGYVPFYYCESGCDDGQALFGPAGGDGVEHSGPVWQARISDGYQPTELVDVSRAWFLVGGGVG